MPLSNYLKLTIGTHEIQVEKPEDLPVSISYELEDAESFQSISAGNALEVVIPATIMNDKVGNTFRNPDIEDLTSGQAFRGNQPCVIEANGYELLNGKAFLRSAKHNHRPISYTFDLAGDNASWIVDLKESTVYDFLKQITFTFSKQNIIDSWSFDGRDEALQYVFAPVRYRAPFAEGVSSLIEINPKKVKDYNYEPTYMKPSVSVYWIIYNAFKSLGYRIQSEFFDTDYFRRLVMPWTWGGFLTSDSSKHNVHRFLAKSLEDCYFSTPSGSTSVYFIDLKVSNDYKDGGFDNNNDYDYVNNNEMMWTYKNNQPFGILEATFSIEIQYDYSVSGQNSSVRLEIHWYKNGVEQHIDRIFSDAGGTFSGTTRFSGIETRFFSATVSETDNISVKAMAFIARGKLGTYVSHFTANVLEFKLEYFRIPIGGIIKFENFFGLKNWKFLELLAGIADAFNLSFYTDNQSKVVYTEPTHAYSLDDSITKNGKGYFVDDFVPWDSKEDLSREWEMINYQDSERELLFKFKDDTNDGLLKVIQDRNISTLAMGKYVFPDRFKSGTKPFENRFFSPVMHYDVDQWKDFTGISPQMVALVPENISNTSQSESENTFGPKLCYYKGNVSAAGGWKYDGLTYPKYPFMFAVNYKTGGENDPILSYSDEQIGSAIGKGLVKRFYWQRLAIMRNGQWYNTFFRLNNKDVAGAHREYKSYKGQRWELVSFSGYKPLKQDSTACLLRRWAAIAYEDFINTYPSAASLGGTAPAGFDIKYAPLKALITDIPSAE